MPSAQNRRAELARRCFTQSIKILISNLHGKIKVSFVSKREFYEANSFELNAKTHKDSIFIIKNENEKPAKAIFIVYFRPEIHFGRGKLNYTEGR